MLFPKLDLKVHEEDAEEEHYQVDRFHQAD